MNFRGAIRKVSSDLSADESMDPSSQDGSLPHNRPTYQPPPKTDGLDPAALGGPSPMNGVAPFGEPVVSDPMLPEPQGHEPGRKAVPYEGPGPDVDVTVLHGASVNNTRAESYQRKLTRFR
jgi:hypothetical protein